MNLDTKARPREASFEIKVIRADGTVEDHGVVSYWHRNPLRRWAYNARKEPGVAARQIALGIAALALIVRYGRRLMA